MKEPDESQMIGFFHENEEYGCFSNWYPARFDYAGLHFANSEQFMMYHKVLMFGKDKLAARIMQTTDPATCKKLAGQKFPEFDSALWEKTGKTIVKRGVKAKFAQNEKILRVLLSTGNALLAECSPYDRKWGIGIDIKDSGKVKVSEWKGRNLLGRILMEVREELRQELQAFPYEKLRYIDARDLGPIREWKMTAGELKSLSAAQLLGCIAWHFRRDHFAEGSLISDSIANGHMLRMLQAYLEKANAG